MATKPTEQGAFELNPKQKAKTPPFAKNAPFLRQGKQDGAPAKAKRRAEVSGQQDGAPTKPPPFAEGPAALHPFAKTPPFAENAPFLRQGKQDGAPAKPPPFAEGAPFLHQGEQDGVPVKANLRAEASGGQEVIRVRGARVHNLKNIDFEIPHNAITVVTGVAGSGKTSLAFDTVYAEGQRRYIESLSAYARQFLERIEKPDVDEVTGIAPAIAIRQKNSTRNPRSTVATATEIYDYLRLLFARIGTTYCVHCGIEVKRDTVDENAERVLRLPAGKRFYVLYPLVLQTEAP